MVPLGHSYFANSRLVLSDIYSIMKEGLNAKSRFSLAPVEYIHGDKKQIYWIFEK
jgi:hypothetical protein